VLRHRAVRANDDDFGAYRNHHLSRERQRVHNTPSLNGVLPAAA
jgi:hypothetical protein